MSKVVGFFFLSGWVIACHSAGAVEGSLDVPPRACLCALSQEDSARLLEAEKRIISRGEPAIAARALPGYSSRLIEEAKARGRDSVVYACVTIRFVLKPDGKKDQFVILNAFPGRVFDRWAVSALKNTEFSTSSLDDDQVFVFLYAPKLDI